jgi:DNA-binding GntR family transcriptional regulator
MPIREAVRRLDHEGLVEITPHTGMRVSALSMKEVIEIFAIRSMLEGLAASMAAAKAPAGFADELCAMNEEHQTAVRNGNLAAIADANWRFHRAILKAADAENLARLLRELWDRSYRFRIGFKLIPGRAEASVLEHAEICRAIRERDSVAAERFARAHIDRAGADLRKTMEHESWDRVSGQPEN